MRRPTGLIIGTLLTLGLVAGACGGSSDDESAESSPATTVATADAPTGADGKISAERCAKNNDAGTITFLTSFDYAAAASIIDVVTAADQGHYSALCLDVKLQPGFSSSNVALVSTGTAQMTSLGSFSEVAVANSQGAALVAVGVEGHASIEELLVEKAANITDLKQLEGKSMGIKGAIPYSLRALLAAKGVDEKKITQIEVDFNPVVLFQTDIVALPVYKSNEPGQLDAQGYAGKYTAFDPRDNNIPASFAVFTTSKSFAQKHPTAVADFLRATLKGFQYAADKPDAAVATTLKRSDPKLYFNPAGEAFRWKTELALVRSSTPKGSAVGAIDAAALQAEVDSLVKLGVLAKGSVDVAASINSSFMGEITKNGELIWIG